MPNSQSLPLLTWRPIAQFLGVIALGGAETRGLIFLMINFHCLPEADILNNYYLQL